MRTDTKIIREKMLHLIGIGVLGNMLSPAAIHLHAEAKFTRVLDRNPQDETKRQRREAWRRHGAKLVTSYEALLEESFDGIVICAGKNGDDVTILKTLLDMLKNKPNKSNKLFILHCSTVSAKFAQVAYDVCQKVSIEYVNYPLTGGTKGAQAATMLILCSGNLELYQKLAPLLSILGKPKYFNEDITTAAKVKLIGHLMVFNGLLGISSAVALQHQTIPLDQTAQSEFFDFLNQGAGGTRQWDVTIKPGICEDSWNTGFLLPHAVIDAIYTADLLISQDMPGMTVIPILQLANAFSYMLQHTSQLLATQALLQYLITFPTEMQAFIDRLYSTNPEKYLNNIIDGLPENLRVKVKLEVTAQDFIS